MALLTIKKLTVTVAGSPATPPIVREVSLTVEPNRIVALVGGSGSGKTTTGLAILRLLPSGLRQEAGQIFWGEEDLSALAEEKMRRIRGAQIAMVFQEPLHAFNPVYRIGEQIEEVLTVHTDLNPRARKERVKDLLNSVGMPDPARMVASYPHQLSGGMRQRAMIAQAIAANPKLLIADEPTSSLDVTLQAKVMALFEELRQKLSLSILLITHDLGVVRHLADEVAVMSAGRIIEHRVTDEIFRSPQEKYTQQLMAVL